jgi:Domain of unknown function (DUF1902)
MEQITYHVDAIWDADAAVWVATSDDVPGLATESETIEALSRKLRTMVPELLHLNHVVTDSQGSHGYPPLSSDSRLPPVYTTQSPRSDRESHR